MQVGWLEPAHHRRILANDASILAAAKVPRGPGAPLIGRSFAAQARQHGEMQDSRTEHGALRKECLEAVRQWPGCETVGGIQIIRSNKPRDFSVRVTLYGKADKKIEDRAIIYIQREKRRHFHLID